MVELVGPRVILRQWREADRLAFRRMGLDAQVMEFMPAPLSAAEADALADRLGGDLARRGWGVWALEVPGVTDFAGMVGLNPKTMPWGECVEVLWRLDAAHWGHGYATEAARLAMAHGFDVLGLGEIVSFTATVNRRSQGVMQRLDMRADGEFDHPALPEGHWLRRHVLYRKTAP
jgi:RimJ/RimL family protein N-acetyltransferase